MGWSFSGVFPAAAFERTVTLLHWGLMRDHAIRLGFQCCLG